MHGQQNVKKKAVYPSVMYCFRYINVNILYEDDDDDDNDNNNR